MHENCVRCMHSFNLEIYVNAFVTNLKETPRIDGCKGPLSTLARRQATFDMAQSQLELQPERHTNVAATKPSTSRKPGCIPTSY